MDSKLRREALRNFLKECRANVKPDDVGLSSGHRRRVPGLRREEVADLAGISLAWYTRLETAQDIRVSPRLLNRLAAVFHLEDEDKIQLFSLALGELPTIPRASPESIGSIGREYSELMRFVRLSRTASNLQELVDLTVDLLFDINGPVEDAYFVKADLASRAFFFLNQRVAKHFEPIPEGNFHFSAVFDANEVLEEADLCISTEVAKKHHLIFAPRARSMGAGRFISKGIRTPNLDCAIGYFQASSEPFSDRGVQLVLLIAEIVHLALTSRY
jgi:transcriptional regulator with XRE-family HTH domain